MVPDAPTRVRLDELVRTTANYRPWLEGASATATAVGVHGFRFDAHDQPSGVTLDTFHVLVCLSGRAAIHRELEDVAEDLALGPGDVLVNPMAVPMRWSWSGSVEVLNVTIHPTYLQDILREDMGGSTRLAPRAVPHRQDAALAQLAADLHRELSEPERLGALRGVRAIGERIAIHLLRHHVDVSGGGGDRTFTREEQQTLLDYVDGRLDQTLRIERLAAVVRLGEQHFTRTFRATFGAPPHAWLRDRRLQRAKQLLTTTAGTISSIAMATGFADQSHLTRCFGARFGTTPAAIRRSPRRQR